MAKKLTKPEAKKSSKKKTEEKPRSTVKEYSFSGMFEVVRQIPKGRVTSYGAIASTWY